MNKSEIKQALKEYWENIELLAIKKVKKEIRDYKKRLRIDYDLGLNENIELWIMEKNELRLLFFLVVLDPHLAKEMGIK